MASTTQGGKTSSLVTVNVIVCAKCVCVCVCACVCVPRFTGNMLLLHWVSILLFLMTRRTDQIFLFAASPEIVNVGHFLFSLIYSDIMSTHAAA